ncbi:hypothetical protein [Stenotrophomonas sp. STK17_22]|uniref:hypothetical protein n=1 Tax=Stenotrophomonas sp. STK17_22 TaxID=3455201 RepID=UPI003F802823
MNTSTKIHPAPQLTAAIAEKYTPQGASEEKTYWTDVGRAFPHANSDGWQLVVRAGLSVSGTVVLSQVRADGIASLPPTTSHFVAYVVDQFDDAAGEKRRTWTEIGRAFPHKKGYGFNLIICRGLSVSGTIVLRAPTETAPRPFADGAAPDSSSLKSGTSADAADLAKLQALSAANADAVDLIGRLLGEDEFAAPEFDLYRMQLQIVWMLLVDAASPGTPCDSAAELEA